MRTGDLRDSEIPNQQIPYATHGSLVTLLWSEWMLNKINRHRYQVLQPRSVLDNQEERTVPNGVLETSYLKWSPMTVPFIRKFTQRNSSWPGDLICLQSKVDAQLGTVKSCQLNRSMQHYLMT